MRVVIIHGQSHEGTTCRIARMLAEKPHGETKEFFLPRDFSDMCRGCTVCITADEHKCPHYEHLKPITEAIDEADVMILASPVYVYHATGAMKSFLDHYAYRWMAHRPDERMYRKQAVCISTAAGAGMGNTNKDMADSTFFWGVAKTYKFGMAVRATSWEGVDEKRRQAIDRKMTALAAKITRRVGKVKPGIKTKVFFSLMRAIQKKPWNPADGDYWREKGWLDKKRLWTPRQRSA